MTVVVLLANQPATISETAARAATRARTYVRGSSVRLIADIFDADTRSPLLRGDLDDLIITVSNPGSTTVDSRRLSDNAIDIDGAIPGRYSCIVDTTEAAGSWVYECAALTDNPGIAKARFHVRESIALAVPAP
jgi:hypothetical protein